MTGTSGASLALLYGQGASNGVISAVTAAYNVNAPVNLPAGNKFSTKLGTSGTTKNYTVITSLGVATDATGGAATLQGMAASANISNNYALGGNIDASGTSSWNSSAGFTPIGTLVAPFTGMFDGLGHTISGLTINLPAAQYVGLFGYAANNSSLGNVGLPSASITAFSSAGTLAGAAGIVFNSYATGTVSCPSSGSGQLGGLVGVANGNMNNAHANVTVTDNSNGGSEDGGLVGQGNASISNAWANGNVTGNNAGNLGGLVGHFTLGTLNNVYATGTVSGASAGYGNVGGLVGASEAAIVNSYATGGVVTSGGYAGGLVGYIYPGASITNAYATGSVNGGSANFIGGLWGYGRSSSTLTNVYAAGTVTSSGSYKGGLVGATNGSITNGYWNSLMATGLGCGSATVTGGGGISVSNMTTLSNFTGFTASRPFSRSY